ITGEPVTYKASFVALKDNSEVDGSLIQEVKKGKDGVSLKLYDKQKAMLELMKYLKDNGEDDNDQITII
ncbi:terminase small subunit, partial [Listeria monocytogenes]